MNNNPYSGKPFLPIKGASDYTGVAQGRLRAWLKAGQIPYIPCGNRYLVNMNGLLKYLEESSRGNVGGV